jgi:hypothetical protein
VLKKAIRHRGFPQAFRIARGLDTTLADQESSRGILRIRRIILK